VRLCVVAHWRSQQRYVIVKLFRSVGMSMRPTPKARTSGFHPVLTVFCVIYVALLICLAALLTVADFLAGNFKKLKRLRGKDWPLAGPYGRTSRSSQRRTGEHEYLQRAAEASGYRGNLDSPSWRSNRLCG
jgi:hypothetical protein